MAGDPQFVDRTRGFKKWSVPAPVQKSRQKAHVLLGGHSRSILPSMWCAPDRPKNGLLWEVPGDPQPRRQEQRRQDRDDLAALLWEAAHFLEERLK